MFQEKSERQDSTLIRDKQEVLALQKHPYRPLTDKSLKKPASRLFMIMRREPTPNDKIRQDPKVRVAVVGSGESSRDRKGSVGLVGLM